MFFYLKKDPKPEPLSNIFRVFFAGCFAVIPVAILELLLLKGADYIFGAMEVPSIIPFSQIFVSVSFAAAISFIIAPFIEEIIKFASVKKSISRDKEFNEPVDAMIYMIVGALGFAAIENFIYLLKIVFNLEIPFVFTRQEGVGGEFFYTLIFRALGATLLHALSSAFLGYLWALAIIKNKISYLYKGVISAGLLHLAFNGIIILMGVYFIFPLAFLLLLAINSVAKKFSKIKSF